MGRRSCVVLAAVVLVVVSAVGSAAASEVSLRAPVPGSALLAFGQTYAIGDRQLTHGGIDLQAGAGDAVVAAATGQVTFAGSVPADDGGRVMAVTILTGDALKVTVSPLSSVSVAAGEPVAAGDELGVLSACGDASVAESHVHLSVRSGERYVDPAPMLAAAAVTDQGTDPGTGAAVDETGADAFAADASIRTGVGPVPVPGGVDVPAAASTGMAAASTGMVGGAATADRVPDPVFSGADDVIGARQRLERGEARVSAAYRRVITRMRCSALIPARPFAAVRKRGSTADDSQPLPAPVYPVGSVAGGAAFLGMGGVVLARIRRQFARGVA